MRKKAEMESQSRWTAYRLGQLFLTWGALQIQDRSPQSRPVSSLNQSQTHSDATGLGFATSRWWQREDTQLITNQKSATYWLTYLLTYLPHAYPTFHNILFMSGFTTRLS